MSPHDVPPPRRRELVLNPTDGGFVLKDPASSAYFQLGAYEAFLLGELDGNRTAGEIRAGFERRFGEPLSAEELSEFVALARANRFLAELAALPHRDPGQNGDHADLDSHETATVPVSNNGQHSILAPQSTPPRSRQSILFWRKRLFDPDRLFTWLEPRIRFIWTPGFAVLTLAMILTAGLVTWANRYELVSYFSQAMRWETLILVWLTLLLATFCHEFAHGLTCKHFGGDVHEIGFLLLFLMPSLYCNVTDAWLFREKSKRLLVTAAGSYCDLVVWSLAVFAWRLTAQDSLINYISWVVLSVAGTRILLNLNPLLKLDGYYFLSDLVEVPNLQPRALAYVLSWARCILWGAPRPEPEKRAGTLIIYGFLSWLFSVAFLSLLIFALVRFLAPQWGLAGWVIGLVLGYMTLRGLLGGVFGGEVQQMFSHRRKRLVGWGFGASAVAVFLAVCPMEDWASGPFAVRALTRAELRAPVAGFLREVRYDEGERIKAHTVLARLDIPNLASRIAEKQAEQREAQARLRQLQNGPRPEELAAQKSRVERAESWKGLAERDLKRAREVFDQEVVRLDKQIAVQQAELEQARDNYARDERLRASGALAAEQLNEARTRVQIARARMEQAEAQKRARKATDIQDAEAELLRREKEQAEARAALRLLEAGYRAEEIDAARAACDRIEQELAHLKEQQEKLPMRSPVAGVLVTPRLRERIGEYFHEGDVVAEVDDPATLEVEIAIPEQEAARLRVGEPVELKVQALPYHTLQATVERICPRATRSANALSSTVSVHCRLEYPVRELRPGMTGHARIAGGRRSAGAILFDRIYRLVRTEFWW